MNKRKRNTPIKMIGKKYGNLLVLEYAGRNSLNKKMAKCLCDCGKEVIVRFEYLSSGHTTSCGCNRVRTLNALNAKHGMYKTRLYSTWRSMINRCRYSSAKQYKDYGGRGIKVCPEWEDDFQAFHDWSMANGYRDDMTIDRIDNDGDYRPENCRWVAMNEQSNNKRNNLILSARGEKHTAAEWSRISGTKYGTILSRHSYGWSDEEAIFGKGGG